MIPVSIDSRGYSSFGTDTMLTTQFRPADPNDGLGRGVDMARLLSAPTTEVQAFLLSTLKLRDARRAHQRLQVPL